jgi:hypothetical protein
MERAPLLAIATAAFLAAARPAVAADEKQEKGEEAAPPAEDGRDSRPALPQNAGAALVRAAAAYEYGDMNQVVEAARPVAEGLLPASPGAQAQAFRLLGIGLFLTNRPAGAESAFKELLRLEPASRLDPTTTRPEVVGFFENLRRQQLAQQRRIIWNFIPPVGQFQNEDNTKGWLILGVGVASLGALVTTRFLPLAWKSDGHTYPGHYDTVTTLRTVNFISAGVLAATYIYGVFDGLIGYSRPVDEGKPQLGLKLLPQGAGLGFAF